MGTVKIAVSYSQWVREGKLSESMKTVKPYVVAEKIMQNYDDNDTNFYVIYTACRRYTKPGEQKDELFLWQNDSLWYIFIKIITI